MAAPIEAGSALVELLPRMVHDAPAAVLLVDLSLGEVAYADRQADVTARVAAEREKDARARTTPP